MYTGIVEECGRIEAVDAADSGASVRVSCETGGLHPDDSISISGTCLTAERVGDGWFEAYMSSETVERTYLASLSQGEPVNVERPLPATGRFDGHVVKATADTVTTVRAIEDHGEDGDWTFTFEVPDEHREYVVEKGAVALDGISLTVSDVSDDRFEVAVVPTTYDLTTLSAKQPGDPVHFEADILAKYVAKQRRVTG